MLCVLARLAESFLRDSQGVSLFAEVFRDGCSTHRSLVMRQHGVGRAGVHQRSTSVGSSNLAYFRYLQKEGYT